MELLSKVKKLSDKIVRKFIKCIECFGWQIESDQGWTDIVSINKTVKYRKYILTFETGNTLECADDHIIIDKDYNEVFAKDSLGKEIRTNYGIDKVTYVEDTGEYENMYDFELENNSNHLYYANGILSHNSTVYTIFATHFCLFNKDKKVLMVANKESTVKELLQRIKMAISMFPDFLKLGVTTWSAKKIEFENGSSIMISATSPDAARGSSCDVCLDESTWVIIKENGIIKQVPIAYLLNKVPVITTKNNLDFNTLLNQSLEELICNDYKIISSDDHLNYHYRNKQQLNFHLETRTLDVPVCPICGKKLYNRFKNGHYYSTCSSSCSKKLSKYLKDFAIDYDGIKILTPNGFEAFSGISSTNTNLLYIVNLSNGQQIKCSNSHKFKTARGLVKAEDLHFNDKLITIGGNYITVNNINKKEGNFYLYDIINSGKDNMFLSNNVFSHNCILDECAFIPNQIMDEFTASVFPTISSKPEGKIIGVSTPNGVGNWFERTYHGAIYGKGDADGLSWTPTTFPWYEHPERDENWKRKQIAMLNGDERKFKQEFECCCNIENTFVEVLDKTTGEIKKITISELIKQIV